MDNLCNLLLCTIYLGRKGLTDTGYVKKYMNPTKLYKGRFEFHYLDEFTGTITGKGPSSS